MRDEARWWFHTAEGDLSAARILFEAGRFKLLEVLRTDGVAVPADLESAARTSCFTPT